MSQEQLERRTLIAALHADLDRDPCHLVDRWILSAPEPKHGALEARSIAKHSAVANTLAEAERKVTAIFRATKSRTELEQDRDQLVETLELMGAILKSARPRPMLDRTPLTPGERAARAAEQALMRELDLVLAALAIQEERRREILLALDVAQGGDGEGI